MNPNPSIANDTDPFFEASTPPAPPSIPNRVHTLVFLLPLVYRPLKPNFAKRFILLSECCSGHIFTLSGSRSRDLQIGSFLFNAAPNTSPLIIRWTYSLWVQLLLPLWLLWGRSCPDVIVAYDPYASGLAGAILKAVLRTKLIVEINGDYHTSDPSERFLKRQIMRFLFFLSIRCADAVKVLNKSQEQHVRSLAPKQRVYRFPDFTAVTFFRALESYQGNYLLSIGYPFHLKGMDVVVQAFKRMAEKHPTVGLRIMGYCPERELTQYKRLAHDNPRIEFIPPGWIEDVGEHMRGCYALVNAARTEAMGRVHLEAMACAKPVVATRTNGGIECVEDGRTGLLCAIDDVEGLARQLDHLLSHPDLAAQMGRAGLQRVQRDFSEGAYIRSFLAMVEDVVGTDNSSWCDICD